MKKIFQITTASFLTTIIFLTNIVYADVPMEQTYVQTDANTTVVLVDPDHSGATYDNAGEDTSIEGSDGSIRVRLRSRFVTVNEIAEIYGGGGHACASGATVDSKKQMQDLLKMADQRLKEYKENNEGWL